MGLGHDPFGRCVVMLLAEILSDVCDIRQKSFDDVGFQFDGFVNKRPASWGYAVGMERGQPQNAPAARAPQEPQTRRGTQRLGPEAGVGD